jgi:hypothetical protein
LEVLLYDLTSTYLEVEMERNAKARRDYRLSAIIDWAGSQAGWISAGHEVTSGNTSDLTTVRGFLKKIEKATANRGGYR